MAHPSGFDRITPEAYSVLVQFYAYDRIVPAEARLVESDQAGGHIRHKVAIRNPRGRPIPALVGIPIRGTAPFPCVLLAHGLGGSKDEYWREGGDLAAIATALLSAGLAILTLDMNYHGERTYANDYEPLFESGGANLYRSLVVESTIEHRMALDYLTGRPDIDSRKLGILGYSLGGCTAFALAALEPRIGAAASCSTWPIGDYYVNRIGWDKSARTLLAPVAPQTFAPAIERTPFLLLNGTADPWGTTEELRLLYELIATSAKELVMSEAGHGMTSEYVPKAVGWFRHYLQS